MLLMVNINRNASIPSSISVSQNFPNPFNPSTSFDVVLPYAQHLKIDILSINGNHIKQITNKSYEQGITRFHWDGRNAAGKFGVFRVNISIIVKGDNFQRWINAVLLK